MLASLNSRNNMLEQAELLQVQNAVRNAIDEGMFDKMDPSSSGKVSQTQFLLYLNHFHRKRELKRQGQGSEWVDEVLSRLSQGCIQVQQERAAKPQRVDQAFSQQPARAYDERDGIMEQLLQVAH
jgi:hypothetical protein